VNTKLRVAMMKSDTPQRDENTGHNGVGATDACNKCPCQRNELWNEGFPCAEQRYRVGIHQAIKEAKATMTPAAFDVRISSPRPE
jgi:hypothetical protein